MAKKSEDVGNYVCVCVKYVHICAFGDTDQENSAHMCVYDTNEETIIFLYINLFMYGFKANTEKICDYIAKRFGNQAEYCIF